MVVIRITDLDLPDGIEHEATDWQVATDMLFSDIVLRSDEDSVNLTSIFFNESLNPDIKYYARARSLLSTGYTTWGNLDAFIPKDVYEADDNTDLPTVVTPPTITTDSVDANHIPTMFNILLTGFGIVGNATHVATSYIIENLAGDVMWANENDYINLNKLLIDDVVLPVGDIYLLKVMFHASSGDVSQHATKIIYVPKVDGIDMLTNVYSYDPDRDNELELKHVCSTKSTEWIIYDKTTNGLFNIATLTSNSTTPLKVDIPANTLDAGRSYLIAVRVTFNDGSVSIWAYEELSTYND